MPVVSAAVLVALTLGAEVGGADPREERPSGAAPPAQEARDARTRAGLLPRKSTSRTAVPSPPRRVIMFQPAATDATTAQGPAAPGAAPPPRVEAAPPPSAAPAGAGPPARPEQGGSHAPAPASAPASAAATAVAPAPLADLVLGALRSRSVPAPASTGAEAPSQPDTSIEDLRVRVSGGRVESVLVGRAAAFTITVQSSAVTPAQATAVSAAGSAAGADATARAAPLPPAPATPAAAPTAGTPTAASATGANASSAPSTVAASPPALRVEPIPADASLLLLRRSTAAGDVVKRTLDPTTGRVTERRFDGSGRLVAQETVDVSSLALVSQRRDAQGRVVQLVRDTSGTFIEVLRDAAGRLVGAWIVRQ